MGHLLQWDRAKRLLLVDAENVPANQRGEVFPVFKSVDEDRVVFNRIPRNSVERHIRGASQSTPCGAELCELHIPIGHRARASADGS